MDMMIAALIAGGYWMRTVRPEVLNLPVILPPANRAGRH
jgi:hypothetical protein